MQGNLLYSRKAPEAGERVLQNTLPGQCSLDQCYLPWFPRRLTSVPLTWQWLAPSWFPLSAPWPGISFKAASWDISQRSLSFIAWYPTCGNCCFIYFLHLSFVVSGGRVNLVPVVSFFFFYSEILGLRTLSYFMNWLVTIPFLLIAFSFICSHNEKHN